MPLVQCNLLGQKQHPLNYIISHECLFCSYAHELLQIWLLQQIADKQMTAKHGILPPANIIAVVLHRHMYMHVHRLKWGEEESQRSCVQQQQSSETRSCNSLMYAHASIYFELLPRKYFIQIKSPSGEERKSKSEGAGLARIGALLQCEALEFETMH